MASSWHACHEKKSLPQEAYASSNKDAVACKPSSKAGNPSQGYRTAKSSRSNKSAVSIKHKECAVKLKLAQYDQQAEISRQREESEALRAQEEIDKELELEFKQLEYKKRLATQRKENIQHNLVIKQKEREVKRAEKEVKAWEEVSNAFTIDQLFESDDGTYADSELHNHPGQAQEPQQERWETRSEINRRVNDRVKNWREGNPYSDSYVNIDSYLPLPPVKPTIAAAVNPLEEAKQIMSSPRFQPSEPTYRPPPMVNNYAMYMDYPPPRPVIPKFEGDPTQYLTFTKSFKTHIGDRGLSSAACLTYLMQHCSAKVQRRLEVFQGKPDGFTRAWHTLYMNYGQPHIVASCYERELLNFPRIAPDNRDAIMDYAILLKRSLSAVEELKEFASLNSLTTLKDILSKLPSRFRYDWTEKAYQLRERTGREAGFHKLIEFIVHKSEVMNSMYGKMEWGNRTTAETKRTSATYKQKPTILSTVKAEDQSCESRSKPKISCVYCKEDHRLPDCEEFQRLSYSEKMKFVKDKRLCFLCLEGNHWTNKCAVKGGCTEPDCKNPKHHTLLHDPSRDKSNEVTQEKALEGQPVKACSSLCATNQKDTKNFLPLLATLPVKVVSGKEELCTYALLDSSSQQTFCTERLVDELKLQGPNHVMQLHAMTQTGGANSIKGKLVSFSVSSLEDHQSSIQLSQVMTVDKLPMQKCQVPGWKELNNWEHLEGLHIPELEDKSVDLLIGTDYAQASVPLESRASSQEGPVAVKTTLGWTLYGPMLKSDEMMPINLTSMHMLVTHQESTLAPHQYVEEGELKCNNSREDRNCSEERPKQEVTMKDSQETSAVASAVMTERPSANTDEQLPAVDRLIGHYSDLHRLKRGTAWMLKFGRYLLDKARRLRKPPNKQCTTEDLEGVERQLIAYEQRRCLNQVYQSLLKDNSVSRTTCPVPILRGNPTLVDGVIRMKGRLAKAPVTFGVRCPILLPFDSHLSCLIVNKYHRRCGHGSTNFTFSCLRERFWLQKGSSLMRKVIQSCLNCKRNNAKCEQQVMADLPSARLQIFDPPFTHSGVDYFGPFQVKQGRSTVKRYMCVFTCMTTRAVHLELATDMTTDCFLNACEDLLQEETE